MKDFGKYEGSPTILSFICCNYVPHKFMILLETKRTKYMTDCSLRQLFFYHRIKLKENDT